MQAMRPAMVRASLALPLPHAVGIPGPAARRRPLRSLAMRPA
jgi:hypothetical protein